MENVADGTAFRLAGLEKLAQKATRDLLPPAPVCEAPQRLRPGPFRCFKCEARSCGLFKSK